MSSKTSNASASLTEVDKLTLFNSVRQNPRWNKKTGGGNIFITAHGDPLGTNALGDTSRQKELFYVPEGIVLIILAPPTHVVFSNDEVDTASWRFFKQKNWAIVNKGASPYNCYGAHRWTKPFDETETPGNEKEDAAEKALKEKIKEMKKSIAGRTKLRHKKTKAKEAKRQEEDDIEMDSDSDSDSDSDEEEPQDKMRQRMDPTGDIYDDKEWQTFQTLSKIPSSQLTGFGREILEHLQIFFPGDACYNQEVNLELEGDGIDFDFDAWYLGQSTCSYTDSHTELPFSINPTNGETFVLKHAHDLKERIESKSQGNAAYANLTPIYQPSYFNARTYWKNFSSTSGGMNSLNTTQRLLNWIATNESASNENPIMVVLNSCSPPRDALLKKDQKGRKNYSNLFMQKRSVMLTKFTKHIADRTSVYNLGINGYCLIRGRIREIKGQDGLSCNTLLPVYDDVQFTRVDKEDRNAIYSWIGQIFQKAQIDAIKSQQDGAQILNRLGVPSTLQTTPFTQHLFYSILSISRFNKRATVMAIFMMKFLNFFGGQQITKGLFATNKTGFTWLPGPSLTSGWPVAPPQDRTPNNLISWFRQLASPDVYNTFMDSLRGIPSIAGGRKKRRRKTRRKKTKRRKRRRRKKKTRRKRRKSKRKR